MLRSVALFSASATQDEIRPVLEGCRALMKKTTGLDMDIDNMPDLLMVAKDELSVVVGLIALYHTEGTKAWKIGSVSASRESRPELVLKFLIDGACSAIRVKFVGTHRAWMVQKVKITNVKHIAWLKSLGFREPENWKDQFLTDDGFVPFDPFDEVLMKKPIYLEMLSSSTSSTPGAVLAAPGAARSAICSGAGRPR
jgi:hypothetical protein